MKILEDFKLQDYHSCKVVKCGNISELTYLNNRNDKSYIKVIDGNRYVLLETGEIHDFKEHNDSRTSHQDSLYRTFRNLRRLVNANVISIDNIRWCTLTYKENMTCHRQLMKDFEKFNKRFLYHCLTAHETDYEYINVVEPQGRGAWHCHVLYFFPQKAPFIPNEVFSKIWSHGFVTIKKLNDCDNVGAYLSAYLGDMEIIEAINNKVNIDGKEVKEIEVDGKKKYYVKGARLSMYPSGMRIYRYSRKIIKPTEIDCNYGYAKKILDDSIKTYEKTLEIDLDNDKKIKIHKEFYKKK